MDDVPAAWQLKLLRQQIEDCPLDTDGFRFSAAPSDFGPIRGIHCRHTRYAKAQFSAEYMPERDDTGYGGPSKGDYHVVMTPGGDGPRDQHNYVPWAEVVEHFAEWISYLAREFEAREDHRPFVRLPSIPPLVAPSDENFADAEIEVIEPLLLAAEEEFIEVIEEELATREDLDDFKAWVRAELADVRGELRRQSKKGFRRTVYGMAGNLGMKFGPDVWKRMAPVFEQLLDKLDSLPNLLSG